MPSYILPFGKAGWEEKLRMLEQIVASRPRPPFIYNDILILVPSSRLRRLYGRLFLDMVEQMHGSRALVQPDIQTLHQFLQKQYGRLRGPRLIDENSRLVLLEGLVKERLAGSRLFDQSADLLAPSLSSVLAKTIEQLAAAGVGADALALRLTGTDFFDKPQVALLLDIYRRYERSLRDAGLTDPAGMRSALRERFDPSWLAPYRAVIVDGLHTSDASETAVLRQIGSRADCTFLIDAPSLETVADCGDSHPLRAVRDLLEGLGLAPERKGGADPDQVYLAGTLFSDRTFDELAADAPPAAGFKKRLALVSAATMREEVGFLARQVKRSLRNGTAADSILVAFPALDEYAALVEEVLTDYGIPYNRALGRQLSSSPVAAAVVALLRAQQEDFSGASLLRVFSSPFLKFTEQPRLVPALDRFLRNRRITGGRQKLQSVLKPVASGESGQDLLHDGIQDLFKALNPFSRRDPASLAAWMERLSGLVAWSGLEERVAAVKGALNVNYQALRKLNEVLASLAQAGATFPDYQYTFDEWLFLLKKTLMHARFQVPPEDEGGVQVLGLEESLAHPWNEIYLGGLIEGNFPQRLPQNIFLPEQTLESLGVRTLERSRLNASYQFYRLLLSADTIMLTYPENKGDRQVVPSPFLQELAPLKKAGLLNRGIEKTSGVSFSLNMQDSCSIPELAKAVSLIGSENKKAGTISADLHALAGALPDLAPGITAIIAAVAPASAAPSQPQPVCKPAFSVTELELYLKCPYDYYITRVVGIEPLEEVSEDISPLERGSKVHALLRSFYLSWKGPVTAATREEAYALLRDLAGSSYDQEADTFRNRREKELFLTVMAGRFLDAEIEYWKQGMKPLFLEQKIEKFPLVLANGEQIELSGKIDRIDVDGNGNFMVVDYKTGAYPAPKMNTGQDIFQLPVYAMMAMSAGATRGSLKRPVGLAYYDLSGKNKGLARDVVLFDQTMADDRFSIKPRASAKSADVFKAILEQSLDRARAAVEGILAGRFPGAPQNENDCRYCPNAMLCEKTESQD